jgi:isoleucyl-tRNA synthetase
MSKDYNKTVNLPSTEFPMRANLPQREPEIKEKWEKEKLYENMMEKMRVSLFIFFMTVRLMQTAIYTWDTL